MCKIENRVFAFRDNPRTVAGWCASEYHRCPAWIADKEHDPAVQAAQGNPRKVACRECLGTGIEKFERISPSGLVYMDERPCDGCAGTGREIYVSETTALVA
jgi:hypothetical protein